MNCFFGLRRNRRRWLCTALALVGGLACGGEERADVAEEAMSPPPKTREIPSEFRIDVEIDGNPARPIDAAVLQRVKPDFDRGGPRIWKLERLLGEAYGRPNSMLEVQSADGVKTVFPRPAKGVQGAELVLLLNRRGEALVALRDVKGVLRPFHGRGGNRGRPGDQRRRIRNVSQFRLFTREDAVASAAPRKAPAEAGSVEVFVDGEHTITWTSAELSGFETLELGSRGGAARPATEAWPLRELVRDLAGPDASVAALQGQGGRSVKIDAAAWNDSERIPVLRLNRRGQFKFEWLSASLKPTRGRQMRAVNRIDVSRGSP